MDLILKDNKLNALHANILRSLELSTNLPSEGVMSSTVSPLPQFKSILVYFGTKSPLKYVTRLKGLGLVGLNDFKDSILQQLNFEGNKSGLHTRLHFKAST